MSERIDNGHPEELAPTNQPIARDEESEGKAPSQESHSLNYEKQSAEDLKAVAKGLMVNSMWSLTGLDSKPRHSQDKSN